MYLCVVLIMLVFWTHFLTFRTLLPSLVAQPIWGWGNAWRDGREFVGQVSYGAVYRLWNPTEHFSFGSRFQRLALTLFGCQRRSESPLCRLSDDILFYILNMCKWDWARDDFEELAGEQRKLRKVRRRREALLAATAAASVSSDAEVPANAKDDGKMGCADGAVPTNDDAEEDDRKPAAIVSPEVGSTSPRRRIFSGDEMRIDSYSDEDEEDEDEYGGNDSDDEDDDSGEDDDSDDYDSDDYDDYRGMNPAVFHYRDYEEEDSEDEAAINEEQRLRDAEARRRSWMRSQFARIHVLNALASMNDGGGGQSDMDVDSDGAAGGFAFGHDAEEDGDSDYVDG